MQSAIAADKSSSAAHRGPRAGGEAARGANSATPSATVPTVGFSRSCTSSGWATGSVLLVRVAAADQMHQGQCKDPQVEPHGPILDVKQVVHNPFLEIA